MKRPFSIFALSVFLLGTQVFVSRPKRVLSVALPKKAPVILKPFGTLQFSPIKESSGLVKSRQWKNVFWTHNDSGDRPLLFPIRRDGTIVRPEGVKDYEGVYVNGAKNRDWEDIATDSKGHLIIGDIGNNGNTRKDLSIYIVREPNPFKDLSVRVMEKIAFVYPDQTGFPPKKKNFDAEAIFWTRSKIYILTKHRSDRLTKLYRLDKINFSKKYSLTLLGTFDIGGQVTGADTSAEGKKLAVLTYKAVWLFEAPASSDNFFLGTVWWLPIKALQSEGIAFDGENLIISNEQRMLFELPLHSLLRVREEIDGP